MWGNNNMASNNNNSNNNNKREDTLIDLLSGVMDSFMESNKQNADSVSNLKNQIDEIKLVIYDMNKKFQNGFKQDIKDYITREVQNCEVKIDKNTESIKNIIDNIEGVHTGISSVKNTLTKPTFWIKQGVAILVAIAAILAAFQVNCYNKFASQDIKNNVPTEISSH